MRRGTGRVQPGEEHSSWVAPGVSGRPHVLVTLQRMYAVAPKEWGGQRGCDEVVRW